MWNKDMIYNYSVQEFFKKLKKKQVFYVKKIKEIKIVNILRNYLIHTKNKFLYKILKKYKN